MNFFDCKCCGESFPFVGEKPTRCADCESKIKDWKEKIIVNGADERTLRELFEIRDKYYNALGFVLDKHPEFGERSCTLTDLLKEIL